VVTARVFELGKGIMFIFLVLQALSFEKQFTVIGFYSLIYVVLSTSETGAKANTPNITDDVIINLLQ
jgi:hypothetical protein